MTITLTKTRMIAGVWEGIFAGVIDAPPPIAVTHHGEQVDGAAVRKPPNPMTGCCTCRFLPIFWLTVCRHF